MRPKGTFTLALVLTGWTVALAPAQSTTTTTTASTTSVVALPSLAELEKGVRALYADVQQRTVRVIVPIQMSPSALGEHPLSKWAPQINPQVRETLTQAA